MTAAIATVSDFPDTAPDYTVPNLWKSRGAVTGLLLTALIVMALAQRGEAATCGGALLTAAELSLPALTTPV